MSRTTTQLTITIPDGAVPGSVLSIPVKGRDENVKARVPEGLGAGDTLVLIQVEGTDEWVEESVLYQAEQAAAAAAATNPAVSERTPTPPPDQLQVGGDTTLGPIGPVEDADLVPEGPVAYTVRLDTTEGLIDIIVRPDWAPHGARRFLQLAQAGDLDGLSFYRSVKGCLAQFGLPARRRWPPLPDDPPTGVPFLLGAVCFAAVGEASRKSTLFICTGDMSHCFGQSPWETPIGAVAEASLDVLDRIETCYGDIAECGGTGPDTGRIHAEGNNYLAANFPRLTYIKSARPLDWPSASAAGDAGARSTFEGSAHPELEVMRAAEAMKAVFQGPGPAVQTAQATQPIDVPIEVKPASHAFARPGMTHPAQSFAGATIAGAAPLRFTAMPQTAGSYILPASGCADLKSFEQQAQAQAQALLQAQRLAGTQDQLGTVKYSSSIQMPVANGHGYHMPPTPSAASPGSYMPPPGVGSGQLMPSPGSFVPPPQNSSFVPPPVSPSPFGSTQPMGSISLPVMHMGSLSGPPGGASACGPCAACGFGPCGPASPCSPCGPGPCGPSGPLGPYGPCGLGGPCAGPFAGPCAGPCGTGPGPGPCGSSGGVPFGSHFSGASATAPLGPMGGPGPGCSGFPGLPGWGLSMPQLPTAHLPPPMMPSLAHPGPGFMPPSPAQFGHAPPGALGLHFP